MPVRPQWPNDTPQHCKIAIIGEAPGQDEAWAGLPFVGASGRELTSQLEAAGIRREDCLLTNVLSEQPPGGNLASFCLRKEELPNDYPLHIGPMVTHGGNYYLHPDRLVEGARLREELAVARPNVVIALGATACWAMLGSTGIGKLRGVVHRSITTTPYKVIPTWHPSAVLRQWQFRPIAISDLVKARVESATPKITWDSAELWLEPTIPDLYEFERRFIPPGTELSSDVETANGEITCVGFAPTPDRAIILPFRTNPVTLKSPPRTLYTGNYWPDLATERAAWRWIQHLLERRRDITVVGQNFLYDIQYFLKYGIFPRNAREDTMLAHHSRYPELPKDLGFLGSVYTNFPMWKMLSARHQDELKRDA